MDELACQHRFLWRRAYLCFWRGRCRCVGVGEVTEEATTTTATPCGPEQAQRRAVAPTECEGHRRSTLDRRRREQPCSSRDGREPARGAARSSRAVCHPPSIAAKGARGGKPDVSEASHRGTQAVVQRRGRPIERHAERSREALGRRAFGRPAAREMRGGRRQAKGDGAVRKPTARRGRADVPPRVPCVAGGKEVGGAPHATDARTRNE